MSVMIKSIENLFVHAYHFNLRSDQSKSGNSRCRLTALTVLQALHKNLISVEDRLAAEMAFISALGEYKPPIPILKQKPAEYLVSHMDVHYLSCPDLMTQDKLIEGVTPTHFLFELPQTSHSFWSPVAFRRALVFCYDYFGWYTIWRLSRLGLLKNVANFVYTKHTDHKHWLFLGTESFHTSLNLMVLNLLNNILNDIPTTMGLPEKDYETFRYHLIISEFFERPNQAFPQTLLNQATNENE